MITPVETPKATTKGTPAIPALRALDVACPTCGAPIDTHCFEKADDMPLYRAPHVERGRVRRYQFLGITALLVVALLLSPQKSAAQFGAIWQGPPPSLNCSGPGLGLDQVTPELYICGKNAQGVFQWTAIVSNAGASLPSAQVGDTIRYNVNGDSAWDAVNSAANTGIIYAFITNTTQQLLGSGLVSGPTLFDSSTAGVYPTATDSSGFQLSSTSSASTNTVIGIEEGAGTATGRYGFGSIYRWSLRFAAGQTTNARYWMGVTVYNSGGSGGETQSPFGTSKFATDTPNCSTIGFRYSSTTDATWKAVTTVTGGSQTTVDTLKAIDTNSHNFEFTYDGITARFFIDGALVGSSTTNLPSTATIYVVQFMTGDNKNTANAVSGIVYHGLLALK